MKFIVHVAAHGDEPDEYEADNIYGVIDQLLDEWVDGDAALPGALAFLAEHEREFGLTDEEVDECTESEVLEPAADAIREILGIGTDEPSLEELALFLAAISSEYQISAADSEEEADVEPVAEEAESADELEMDEEYEKALDEDYDY